MKRLIATGIMQELNSVFATTRDMDATLKYVSREYDFLYSLMCKTPCCWWMAELEEEKYIIKFDGLFTVVPK